MIKFILLLIFIPAGFLTVFFGFNYSGFCFAEMRYLSDDEVLKAFFEEINSQKLVFIDTPKNNMGYFENIPYTSYESYIYKYPDCCGVNTKQGYDLAPPNILDKIFGYNSGDVVTMNFNVTYLDRNGFKKYQMFQFEEFVTNCGNHFKY